ncbi:unnamed protein product [Adineta steineri]|uniref:Uncharacterized protein n=1 Tax=Adineta steineri TaxID=433720 RepID=A0A814QG87_9BILA|nr:unnamed protein product [Adineta steineri]
MTESTTVTNPITLSSNDKEKLDKLVKDLSKTERKNGQYYFSTVSVQSNTSIVQNSFLNGGISKADLPYRSLA